MGEAIRVRHVERDRYEVSVRGHRLSVDQPADAGGEDSAPTPTELFISGLAACVAHYAGRYLARHDLPTDGLGVDATYEWASRPARVGQVTLQLRLPPGLPEDSLPALLAVASHCSVHNSLEQPPAVRIELHTPEAEAA